MTQPHRTLQEAAALLAEKGIGAAIVADGAGEVMEIFPSGISCAPVGRFGGSVLNDPVSKHMTSKVVSTNPAKPSTT